MWSISLESSHYRDLELDGFDLVPIQFHHQLCMMEHQQFLDFWHILCCFEESLSHPPTQGRLETLERLCSNSLWEKISKQIKCDTGSLFDRKDRIRRKKENEMKVMNDAGERRIFSMTVLMCWCVMYRYVDVLLLMCWWLCWCVDVLIVLMCWCVDCVDVLLYWWLRWCWCDDVLMCWCDDVLMTVLMCWWLCWCVDVLMCWCVDVLMCWCVDGLMWCVDALMCWCADGLMWWCVDDCVDAGWRVDGLMGWWLMADGLMG
jgi:hypothetical protein